MEERKKWFIIVNLITFSRIIGSIFLFPLYFSLGPKIIGIILAILFLTDWIDGYLARKFKVSTFFGSIMDTICDKLIAIVACTVLCFLNPYMIYSIIVEALIALVSALNVTQNNTAKASYVGKVKMWILSMCVVVGFFICKPDKDLINLFVFIPAIVFELITFYGYLKKVLSGKFIVTNKKPKYKNKEDIKMMLFSPEFYEKNKDKKGLLDNIYDDGK